MEREVNIIQVATMYTSPSSPSSSSSSSNNNNNNNNNNININQDLFDIDKFTRLICDLICLRDHLLYIKDKPMNLIHKLATFVEVQGGVQYIEIKELITLFNKWNTILENEEVKLYGGHNLPNIGDYEIVLNLIELHQQREKPIPFHPSSTSNSTSSSSSITTSSFSQTQFLQNQNNWMFCSGNNRGLLVPIDMIEQRNGWKFIDHGDGSGILYYWPGINTLDGQFHLSQGKMDCLLIQQINSCGAPILRISNESISTRNLTTSPNTILINHDETKSNLSISTSPITTTTTTTILPRSIDHTSRISLNNFIPVQSTVYHENVEMAADSNIPIILDEPDPRVQLLLEIDERIHRIGGRSIEVGSGGDCFFRCLTAQHPYFNFTPSDENSLEARHGVVKYLLDNSETYQNFIAYNENITSFTRYIDYMSQPHTWIEGGLEILATAITWNVRIHIYGAREEYDRVVQPYRSDDSIVDIYMVHYHDYHYRVFQFVSNSNQLNQSNQSSSSSSTTTIPTLTLT